MQLRTFVLVFLCFCQALYISVQTPELPDTPAGKLVAAYLKAFNAGDEQLYREFITNYLAKSAPQQVSIEERLKRFRDMRARLGGYELQRVLRTEASSIQLLAKTKQGELVELIFELEAQPPHGLLGLRIEQSDGSGNAGNRDAPGVVRDMSPAKEEVAAKLDEYLTRLAGFGFTGGVLLAKDDQVLIEKGYGLADRGRNLPFTKETVFDIGSNTKDFTKLAILQLAERKRLSLDDPITRFFDNVPGDKAAIKVEHLMNHTAGIGMYSGRDQEKLSKEELLKRVFGAALLSEPGKEERYSNPGYGLLAAIIEKVSGQTYEQYVQDHILKPAGMTTTGYILPKWRDGQLTRNYEDGEERPSTFDYAHLADGASWSLRGNGGTLSTLGDMYKFHRALAGEQLLSKEFKEQLFSMNSPQTLVGGNGVHFFVYHRDPANQLAVIIATTDASVRAMEVNGRILSLVRGREVALPPVVVKLNSAALQKYTGTYHTTAGAELQVSVKGDHLFVAGANQAGAGLLLGSGRGNEERDKQITEMLEAGAQGNYSLAHKAFGDAMPFEQFKQMEEPRWQWRRQQFGAYKGVTILGTTAGQGTVTTARLDFERGSEYVQFIWGGGMLRGMRLGAPPPGTAFFPQTAAEFVSFNLGSGESTHVTFKTDEQAAISGLLIKTKSGVVSAAKIK